MKSNLTLNLGARLEQETGMTERYGRIVNGFDTNTPNPIAPAVQSAYAANYSTYVKDCAATPAYCPPAPSALKVNGGLTFGSPSDPYVIRAAISSRQPSCRFCLEPVYIARQNGDSRRIRDVRGSHMAKRACEHQS